MTASSMRVRPEPAPDSFAYVGENIALPIPEDAANDPAPRRRLSNWGHPRRSPLPIAIVLVKLTDFAAAIGIGLLYASEYVRFAGDAVGFREAFLLLLLGSAVFLQTLRKCRQYDKAELAQGRNVFRPLVPAVGLSAATVAIVSVAIGQPVLLALTALIWLLGLLGVALIARGCLMWFIRRWQTADSLATRIVVVGATEVGHRVIRAALEAGDGSVKIVGVYDDRKDRLPPEVLGCPILGTVKDLMTSRKVDQVDRIIIALPWSAEARILAILKQLRNASPDIALAPDLAGYLCQTRYELEPAALLQRPVTGTYWLFKAFEDRLLGLLLLFGAAPLMLIIAALIKFDTPGPVFFAQSRFGVHNRVIRVLKFRTMRHEARDPLAVKQTDPNDERVTRIGRFLRRYSLDELPQLINVVRGEMSLIGPRPYALRMNVGSRFAKDILLEYALRRHVKPGITGWAQVNGHAGPVLDEGQFQARLRYDLHYVENWSPALDFRILFRTFGVVLSGRSNA